MAVVGGLRGGIGGSSRRGTGRFPIVEPDDDDDDDDDDDGIEALVGRAVAEGVREVGLLVGTRLSWSLSGLVMVVLVVAAAVAAGRTTDAISVGEARGTGSDTVSTFDTTGAETTLMAAAGTAGSAAVDTVGAAVLGSVDTAVGGLATSGAREGMIRSDGRDEEWLADDIIVGGAGGAGGAGIVGPGGIRVAVMARTRPPTRGESGMLHARAGGTVGEAGAAKEGGRWKNEVGNRAGV